MGINLWVLYYDLSKWEPKRSCLGDVRINMLEYFSFYHCEENPDPSCLYLIQPEELADAYLQNPDTAFLCLGDPGDTFTDISAEILWISDPKPLGSLISDLSACFHRYQSWYTAMTECIQAKKPLKYFANLALPVFRQPVSLYSSNFMSLCFAYNEKQYGPLPKDYSIFKEGMYISEDVMQDMENGGSLEHCLTETAPYLYITNDGFRSLCANIWIMNRNIAILDVDEINEPITQRDHALIYILSQVMQEALKVNNMINFSLQSEFCKNITDLLDGKQISISALREGLQSLNWSLEDRYSCLVLQSLKHHTPGNALWVNGESLIHFLPNTVYVIDQGELILICNRFLPTPKKYQQSLRNIRDKLVNINMIGGVSNDFTGFEHLKVFVESTRQATMIGQVKTPGQYLYFFQNYALDIAAKNCLSSFSSEVFIPSELLDVIQYDQKKGSDYCKVLYSLLRNNMSPTDTAAELYMHRNTIINRLGLLKSKFHMNLDSFSVRQQLILAFQLMEQQDFFAGIKLPLS